MMEKCLKCEKEQYAAKLCKYHYALELDNCDFGKIKYLKENKKELSDGNEEVIVIPPQKNEEEQSQQEKQQEQQDDHIV